MKKLIGLIAMTLVMFSCGPNAEKKEQQRIQDSIHAETDRLSSIEEADAFIMQNQVDTTVVNDIAEEN